MCCFAAFFQSVSLCVFVCFRLVPPAFYHTWIRHPRSFFEATITFFCTYHFVIFFQVLFLLVQLQLLQLAVDSPTRLLRWFAFVSFSAAKTPTLSTVQPNNRTLIITPKWKADQNRIKNVFFHFVVTICSCQSKSISKSPLYLQADYLNLTHQTSAHC